MTAATLVRPRSPLGIEVRPERAIILARISSADLIPGTDIRVLDTAGVDRQIKQAHAHCERLGWTVARVVIENHTSAWKTYRFMLSDGVPILRTKRPKLAQVIRDLDAGLNDGLCVVDLDRYARTPVDLEMIVAVRERGRVPVTSITGTLRLDTASDVATARILVAVKASESDATSRRVKAHRDEAIQELRVLELGGKRPFGFRADADAGTYALVPDEVWVLREAAKRVLSGESLRGICKDLNVRGAPRRGGAPWSATHLRQMLTNPRYAARLIHRGEDVGEAPWKAVFTMDRHERLAALLTDPSRRCGDHRQGRTPQTLGSGLYRCHCGSKVRTFSGKGGRRYRCRVAGGDVQHVSRLCADVDTLVRDVVIARLSRADMLALMPTGSPDVDADALRDEAGTKRALLEEMAVERARGDISSVEFHAARRVIVDRLTVIDRALADAAGETPLAPFLRSGDVAAVWDGLSLSERRTVLAALMTVTLMPSPRRGGPTAFGPIGVAFTGPEV